MCEAGLREMQNHFSSRAHPYQGKVVQLLPGESSTVLGESGRHVEVHLEFSHVDARCALPFEMCHSRVANPNRSFRNAAVDFTVQVCCFFLYGLREVCGVA